MTVHALFPFRSTLIGSLLFLLPAAFPGSAAAETVTVKVSGLHGTAGSLHVMIWKDAAGFPMQPEKAIASRSLPVAGSRMEVAFPGLPRGTYAVAAYQDVNGNGKLDRSIMGWPTEPVGASNGATGIMGPPKFADAAFPLQQPLQIVDVILK